MNEDSNPIKCPSLAVTVDLLNCAWRLQAAEDMKMGKYCMKSFFPPTFFFKHMGCSASWQSAHVCVNASVAWPNTSKETSNKNTDNQLTF